MNIYKEVLPKMKRKRGESTNPKPQDAGDVGMSWQAAEWHSHHYHLNEQELCYKVTWGVLQANIGCNKHKESNKRMKSREVRRKNDLSSALTVQ